jgi:hypothetical protein
VPLSARPHVARVMFVLLVTQGTFVCSAEADFERDVLPVLTAHCIDCHGPDTAEAQLRLDSPTFALRGGDSGERVVFPGESEKSYLIERVTHIDAEKRMPPESDPLSSAQVAILKAWIDEASNWTQAQAEIDQQKSDHWSFQPLMRPQTPANFGAHPIDAFLRAKLVDAGLDLSPQANRRRQIRRLYLVMLGLPPTPERVEQFVNDDRGNAWKLLVDEVLQSPQYGERWATYWLDLARFGESHGFETNRERPNAWHYRDWVIQAFNDDKPYNDFVMEQVAGDSLGAEIGTGFLVAGPYDLVKGQDPLLRLTQRQDELADMINTTGTAFMGLTLGCARCHNHKFDPISQTDFYALQAVFAGVNHADRALPLPANAEQQVDQLKAGMAKLADGLQKFLRRPPPANSNLRKAVNAERNDENFPAREARQVRFTIRATNASQPCIDELEIFSNDKNVALASTGARASSSGDFVHALHKLKHINDGQYGNAKSWISSTVSGGWVQIEFPQVTNIDRIVWGRDRLGQYGDRIAIDYRIEASLDGTNWQLLASSSDRMSLKAATPPGPQYDFSQFPPKVAERGKAQFEELKRLQTKLSRLAKPTMAYVGTFSQPGPTHRLYRGEPTAKREQVAPAALHNFSDARLAPDSPEKARRLAIARWIASEQNPLTARVMVNRVWQHQFGAGLVDTPSDFGANGSAPTHPELLDWLAVEFMENDWSVKHIQRLILSSSAWRQDSRPTPKALSIDASSRLLWRFPPRRLEAEGIRDSILAASGKLDLRAGGPGFSAFEVQLENVRHYFPKKNYGAEDWRRMIYMTKVRQERDSVFGVFDCPDCNQVVPKRSRSTTPLQALNLLNSRFVNGQAEFLVKRIQSEADSPAGRVARAYQLCYGRAPADDEVQLALGFIDATDWQQFARALLNTNEFVFIP